MRLEKTSNICSLNSSSSKSFVLLIFIFLSTKFTAKMIYKNLRAWEILNLTMKTGQILRSAAKWILNYRSTIWLVHSANLSLQVITRNFINFSSVFLCYNKADQKGLQNTTKVKIESLTKYMVKEGFKNKKALFQILGNIQMIN